MSSQELARPEARTMSVMKYSVWDWVPAGLGLLHFTYLLGIFAAFPFMPWPLRIAAGLLYAISISWSINSISHNFIHNPFFVSPILNTLFSYLLSVTNGFSQAMYNFIHMRHHSGNMDRPDAKGDTVDPISIYRHGRDGKAENVWIYSALSFFRDDPPAIYRAIKAKRPIEARWALIELAVLLAFIGCLSLYDWRFVLAMAPFYYLGHSLSALNGYYEHAAGNPDLPLAWGVSSYNPWYNLTWMNNGYHAEHHYRPGVHWTRMHALHMQVAEQQRAAGLKTLSWPHVFGFMDRNGGP
jgi:fatty acid desaturase